VKKIVNIDKSDYINAINMHLGLYNPLEGFVTLKEYENILKKKKLKKKNFLIPLNLFCTQEKARQYKLGENIYFKYKKEIVGFISLKSKFKVNKKKLMMLIFGTTSQLHKGVKIYKKKIDEKKISLGGKVFIFENKVKKFFYNNNISTVKKLKKIKNLNASFSTRNIPHIGHNLIQKKIIEITKNLTIFLILSEKNKYNEKILFNSYKALKKNKIFNKINIFFIYIPTFFAGPKETFLQAKIFENLKFKSFYVGRDHAGYKKFYGKFDSQKIFDQIKCKIKIIKFNEPMMCEKCKIPVINKFKNKRCCPTCKSDKLYELNGTDIKNLIKTKKIVVLSKLLDPLVFNFLKKKKFSLQNN